MFKFEQKIGFFFKEKGALKCTNMTIKINEMQYVAKDINTFA